VIFQLPDQDSDLVRPRCTLPGVRAQEIISSVFAMGDQVRYVAVATGQDVELRQRPGLADASSSESDRFEELLVNPVLLLLTRQRGEIDCGGLRDRPIRQLRPGGGAKSSRRARLGRGVNRP
jgi:hypothetical protein